MEINRRTLNMKEKSEPLASFEPHLRQQQTTWHNKPFSIISSRFLSLFLSLCASAYVRWCICVCVCAYKLTTTFKFYFIITASDEGKDERGKIGKIHPTVSLSCCTFSQSPGNASREEEWAYQSGRETCWINEDRNYSSFPCELHLRPRSSCALSVVVAVIKYRGTRQR